MLVQSLHRRKRAYTAHFRQWRRWWWCEQKVSTVKNEHTLLVFDSGGGGGGVNKKSPPSKTSIRCSFLTAEVVVVLSPPVVLRRKHNATRRGDLPVALLPTSPSRYSIPPYRVGLSTSPLLPLLPFPAAVAAVVAISVLVVERWRWLEVMSWHQTCDGSRCGLPRTRAEGTGFSGVQKSVP